MIQSWWEWRAYPEIEGVPAVAISLGCSTRRLLVRAQADMNCAMARMYPRKLLADDVKSRAERRVFDALEGGLDDDWNAFHSVSWMIRDPAEGARDGEID